MNRAQRREFTKGSKDSQEMDNALKYLDKECTISEVVKISRGVAEDVVTDYQKRTSPLQVAISIQIDMLKDIALGKLVIVDEEHYHEEYMRRAEEFTAMQQEYLSSQNNNRDTVDIRGEDYTDISVAIKE